MLGVFVFQRVYSQLHIANQNKILGNMFHIKFVSVSNISIRDTIIIFRIYADGVFYQYIFDWSDGNHNTLVQCSNGLNIVSYYIYLCKNYLSEQIPVSLSYLCEVINILMSDDEKEIYRLIAKFL